MLSKGQSKWRRQRSKDLNASWSAFRICETMQRVTVSTIASSVGKCSVSLQGTRTYSVQTVTRLSVPSVGWSASLQPKGARQRRSPGSARYAQRVEKCGRSQELGSLKECQNKRKRRNCLPQIWEKGTKRRGDSLFINLLEQKKMSLQKLRWKNQVKMRQLVNLLRED